MTWDRSDAGYEAALSEDALVVFGEADDSGLSDAFE
jgi:hypothetical protein